MAVKIRLARWGSKGSPFYHVVVADARSPRDGKFLEKVGTYNPMLDSDNAERVVLKEERIRYWLSVGAQPTDRVERMLKAKSILEGEYKISEQPKQSKPKAKAVERAAAKQEKAQTKQEEAEAEA